MKKLILTLLLAAVSVVTFGQGDLKISWNDVRLNLSLPYPSDNGYEIDDFGYLYVYSDEFPLALYTSTCIDNTDVTPDNYKELFIKSTNGQNVTTTMLDNGILVVQFNWDSGEPQFAFVYLIDSKRILAADIKDYKDGVIEHLKKIKISKQ